MGAKIALLDTSILIDFFRKTDKKNSRFYLLSDKFDSFSISVITEYEIFVGATSTLQKDYWNAFLERVSIISLDSTTVRRAILLSEELKRARKHFDRISDLKLVE